MQPSVPVREQNYRGMRSSADRRAEVRFATKCPAKMRILTPASRRVIDVEVTDTSMSGVRIETRESLDVGVIVQLTFDRAILVAEVRNCVPLQDGYRAGLFVSVFYDRNDPATHETAAPGRTIVVPS